MIWAQIFCIVFHWLIGQLSNDLPRVRDVPYVVSQCWFVLHPHFPLVPSGCDRKCVGNKGSLICQSWHSDSGLIAWQPIGVLRKLPAGTVVSSQVEQAAVLNDPLLYTVFIRPEKHKHLALASKQGTKTRSQVTSIRYREEINWKLARDVSEAKWRKFSEDNAGLTAELTEAKDQSGEANKRF